MSQIVKGKVIHLDRQGFQRALKLEIPIVVDFWAEWCAPCHALGPILEELAEEYADRALVGKVNVDNNPELAARYNISSIPNLKFFKSGREVENIVGVAPIDSIRRVLNRWSLPQGINKSY